MLFLYACKQDVFQYSVEENVEVQSEIANITATDSDVGENGEVFYMIVGKSPLFIVQLVWCVYRIIS